MEALQKVMRSMYATGKSTEKFDIASVTGGVVPGVNTRGGTGSITGIPNFMNPLSMLSSNRLINNNNSSSITCY